MPGCSSSHLALLILFALAAAVVGCAQDRPSRGAPSANGGGGGGAGAEAPLSAERLAIHPLTRFAADADGNPVIVCHFELRDRFEQAIRALGTARVELFRPGSEFADGSQTQDLIWRTDLSTPEANARQFDDLVTRTYTLSLGGLPDWLLAWRDGEGEGAGAGAVSPTLRVTFFPGEESAEGQLTDVFRLGR